ncbi:uncharacterized protein GGS22DRAFT_188083 [Annulohypoxylon maeteangense]|uniref:uncharacterized protein n=1 Tax=Annulohypoxylon maeteangense TaxID=1927788 RepID=UPI0020079F29|nr:uncharacterized protein GGS22DRAFT_188083 [Annulohypoxylon maeteangense]KAI0885795.1 hypothetical protein GGS22DRAFT_188083 [Annulohypoxylon maeteangense]
MEYQTLLLALFTLISAVWATASTHPVIFHGTSVLTFPSDDVSSSVSHTKRATEFFSYMTEKGYFSFGWWVSADGNGDTSHFQPDLDSFHWLELAVTKSCDEETGNCLYRVQNVPIRQPDDMSLLGVSGRSLKYVVQPPLFGERDSDRVALTYIDGDGVRIHGVGTRQKLSDEKRTAKECQNALRTLKRYYEINDVDLGFEIRHICAMQDRGTGRGEISEL